MAFILGGAAAQALSNIKNNNLLYIHTDILVATCKYRLQLYVVHVLVHLIILSAYGLFFSRVIELSKSC